MMSASIRAYAPLVVCVSLLGFCLENAHAHFDTGLSDIVDEAIGLYSWLKPSKSSSATAQRKTSTAGSYRPDAGVGQSSVLEELKKNYTLYTQRAYSINGNNKSPQLTKDNQAAQKSQDPLADDDSSSDSSFFDDDSSSKDDFLDWIVPKRPLSILGGRTKDEPGHGRRLLSVRSARSAGEPSKDFGDAADDDDDDEDGLGDGGDEPSLSANVTRDGGGSVKIEITVPSDAESLLVALGDVIEDGLLESSSRSSSSSGPKTRRERRDATLSIDGLLDKVVPSPSDVKKGVGSFIDQLENIKDIPGADIVGTTGIAKGISSLIDKIGSFRDTRSAQDKQ